MVYSNRLVYKNKHEAGFILLELILGCTIGATLLGIGAGHLEKSLRRRESQAIAYQLRQITDAAKQYVRDHYESIHQTASSGFESKFTVEELQDTGYLDSSIQLSNSFKQSYQIRVAATELSDQPAQLSVLVLSEGGIEIPQEDAQHIAGYAGGDAGYVDRRSDGTSLSGTSGAWVVDGIVNATYGHIGSLNFVRESEIIDAQNFLMRKKIVNHPEYNQMQTDLDMLSNNIAGSSGDVTYQISAVSGIHLSCATDASKPQVKFMASKRGENHRTEMIPDGFYVTSGSKQVVLDSDNLYIRNSTGNKINIFADHIELSSYSQRNIDMRAEGITANAPKGSPGAYNYEDADESNSSRYSELNGSYIKFPVYHTHGSDRHSWWETAPRICEQVAADPKDRFGKAFVVSSFYNGEQQRRLIMCTPTGAMVFDGETVS